MTMTPRDRWLALLNRKTLDRIPTDYQATDEVTARLRADLRCPDNEALYRRLHIDGRRTFEPVWPGRRTCRPKSICGVSAIVRSRTARARILNRIPASGRRRQRSPDSRPSLAVVRRLRLYARDETGHPLDQDDGYRPIHAGVFEPFLLYGTLRGLQTSMEDLALRPEIADAILGHIFDFCYEHHRRMFEAGGGRIDLTYVAEDLGSQTGPLMSLAMYRRFLLPNQIKMAELARCYRVHVMYHTDGAARMFLPDLIDRVGIELLNPIQWRCPGMEREKLVADFGDRLIFHGSIDNQQTLPFGTPEDVVQEVRESVEIYREPAGSAPLPQPPAGQPYRKHRSHV